MPYLVPDRSAPTQGSRLRSRLAADTLLVMPGAHDGLAALQARRAGFEALYLSGAAMTASMGIPDLGMITLDEVAFFTRTLVRAADLPVLVDIDTGFGEALNVMHAVRTLEDAGAAAVQIEDQVLPKKCGHLNDKRLADPRDAAAKIAAAGRARRIPALSCAAAGLCRQRVGAPRSAVATFCSPRPRRTPPMAQKRQSTSLARKADGV